MLKVLRNLLEQIITDIDSGNTNITKEQELQTIQFLRNLTSSELSKIEAANYIGVSRATFDNYVSKGLIPYGIKRQGRNLLWLKSDLDKFKNNRKC